jgi:hypothetical protein
MVQRLVKVLGAVAKQQCAEICGKAFVDGLKLNLKLWRFAFVNGAV